MLNRFLVGQLIKLGVVTYISGALDYSSVQKNDDKFKFNINGILGEANHVVVRHGPAKKPIEDFPAYNEALKPVRKFLMTYSAGVDRTRRRTWKSLSKGSVAANSLPQITSDVLSYIGQHIQAGIQQELIRLQKVGEVAYECLQKDLKFSVLQANQSHTATIKFSTNNQLLITCKRASGEEKMLPVDMVVENMANIGLVTEELKARIPAVIEWFMEESI